MTISNKPVLKKVPESVVWEMTHDKQSQNHLDGVNLTLKEEVEHKLVSHFTSIPKEFYKW